MFSRTDPAAPSSAPADIAVRRPMRQAVGMPNTLPFPIRVAAGLVSAGIETFRRLPADLPAMGVELAGTVTKVALRVRQEITDLAIRGDELLEPTQEPVERPSWARFDDDAPVGAGAEEVPFDQHIDVVTPRAADTGPTSTPEPSDILRRSPALPGYDGMTLAQVRGHLRRLAVGDVQSLLRYEQTAENRPAFVTMLTNRISTLEHQAR